MDLASPQPGRCMRTLMHSLQPSSHIAVEASSGWQVNQRLQELDSSGAGGDPAFPKQQVHPVQCQLALRECSAPADLQALAS